MNDRSLSASTSEFVPTGVRTENPRHVAASITSCDKIGTNSKYGSWSGMSFKRDVSRKLIIHFRYFRPLKIDLVASARYSVILYTDNMAFFLILIRGLISLNFTLGGRANA